MMLQRLTTFIGTQSEENMKRVLSQCFVATIRGFKCWITVSIRNPEEIKKIQNRGTLDFSSHKTMSAY